MHLQHLPIRLAHSAFDGGQAQPLVCLKPVAPAEAIVLAFDKQYINLHGHGGGCDSQLQ